MARRSDDTRAWALLLVQASISLTETLRDRHEAEKLPAPSEFGR